MKKINTILSIIVLSLLFGIGVLAAPTSDTYVRTLLPESGSTYNVGAVGNTFLGGYFDNIFGGNATTTGSVYIGHSLGLNSEYFSDLTGTGLQNSAGVLTTNDGAIDHDSLLNYVSNEHIDWTNTTANLFTTGYASTTAGLFTQGNLHIGGNSTFDGTITNGTSTDLVKMTAGVFSNVGDPVKNYVPIFNGSTVVWAAQGTTFTFSIATFTDNATYSQEIGTGDAIAIGDISFSATYNNGPATSGSVQIQSGTTAWGSALDLTGGSYLGPTTNTEAVTYPAAAGTTVTFRLTAGDGTDTDTANTYIVYNNYRFWGVTSKTDTFTEADVEGLAGSELSNSKDKSFSNTTGSGEYALWASRTALGTVTFSVDGFSGGFQSPETVSITTAAGYTENFYVYRSTNLNLGTITIIAD